MFTPNKRDIQHKVVMFNLLNLILKDSFLAQHLMFKGGTYASLRGFLDRFSVDLDFDLPFKEEKEQIRERLYKIFKKLDLQIKDESKNYLQFFLKYDQLSFQRNTLKLEINDAPSKFNEYEKAKLLEISSYCNGHTPDTMVANKLLAAKGRYDKNGKISGRDFYDINYFLKQGLKVNKRVVEDISGLKYKEYIAELIDLIQNKLTIRLLNEDLNPLLPKDALNKKLPLIKDELIFVLKQE
ncbi:nucleotidyl transferase AbiEii/AbiGii toxin family protein [Candidatus Parcubacteria bacterium]|nr:nucleotidyl transferase AbiEii/AbiGii toxin family protein [Patescibacteria group bacterium]MBU4380944.1 nucleotidyl transferase AbiEii/AbiGii toxin family protein [Patescibacteria group bacterium]MCG2689462.1 nucleotidyl transferase AbiEii/AbiGii toxin family protein [Candidatus Parcubacteria bacterium]